MAELLDVEETARLTRLAQAGDLAARNALVAANDGLVKFVCKRLGPRLRIPFEDAFQEGMIGLLAAIDRYDPDLGFKFSTYAIWWITKMIKLADANTRSVVRVPVHHARAEGGTPANHWRNARRAWGAIASYDALPQEYGRDDDGPAAVDRRDEIAHVCEAVRSLPDGQRRMLERLYGLDGRAPASTMRAAAREFGLARNGVSVIHERAIRAIRKKLAS